MKNRRMRLMAIFAAGVLSVTSMGGIVTAHAEETLSVPAEEAGAGAVQMDGKDAQAAEDGSVAASEGLIAGSFKPSEIAQPAQDTYEYPFLGMKLGISKDLKEQMEKKNISMFTDERWNDNADAVTYATASWCTLTDEQKEQILQGALLSLTDEEKAQIREGYIQQMMASDEVTAQLKAAVAAVSSAAEQVADLKGQLDSYGAFYQGLLDYTGAVSSATAGMRTLKLNMDM